MLSIPIFYPLVISLDLGMTPEQIASGVKQWYAWYERKYDRFKERYETEAEEAANEPYVNPLEDLIDLESMSPAEREQYLKDVEALKKKKR